MFWLSIYLLHNNSFVEYTSAVFIESATIWLVNINDLKSILKYIIEEHYKRLLTLLRYFFRNFHTESESPSGGEELESNGCLAIDYCSVSSFLYHALTKTVPPET